VKTGSGHQPEPVSLFTVPTLSAMPHAESAGLLLYRNTDGKLEVLLAHMGGPFWANKERAWTIPKGLREDGEADYLTVAEREFAEEMGTRAPSGDTLELGSIRTGQKTVIAFAREADFDARTIVSNTFIIEWPYRSGRMTEFPEVDRAGWFGLDRAATLLIASQVPFLSRLAAAVQPND
jgi:predicted NUDIX family NTP pyrophosphohydrolase